MKTLAIIGSDGMLGSDLVRYLSAKFHITSINKKNYSTHIGDSFDIVINANGNSKRYWANNNPVEDFIVSTESVYKSIFDFKHKIIYIYISSSDVYENHSISRYTHENTIIKPEHLSSYGLHKYISELLVKKYATNYLLLRSSMILGTNIKKGPLYDIFHRLPLYITKDSKLQFITSKEIATIIHFLLQNKIHNQIFNMGGRGSFSFLNIEKFIKIPITYSENGEKQQYEMNVMKLLKLYPLKTSTEYLQNYLKTYEKT